MILPKESRMNVWQVVIDVVENYGDLTNPEATPIVNVVSPITSNVTVQPSTTEVDNKFLT